MTKLGHDASTEQILDLLLHCGLKSSRWSYRAHPGLFRAVMDWLEEAGLVQQRRGAWRVVGALTVADVVAEARARGLEWDGRWVRSSKSAQMIANVEIIYNPEQASSDWNFLWARGTWFPYAYLRAEAGPAQDEEGQCIQSTLPDGLHFAYHRADGVRYGLHLAGELFACDQWGWLVVGDDGGPVKFNPRGGG